ncbi:IclR family transcriptional regulator [Comamonas sp. J-3]|uniref:IclR family transcriptional regulator n=1 Tax=Comamonas trifloxystrobinivorans TaxID=3350256 RepID=UPI00372AD05F
MKTESKKTEGARSVYRALELLDLIARHQTDGISLPELVAITTLDRTTVYRLLSTLESEHLVERDTNTRRYFLGMESMQIGLSTMSRAPILDEYVPMMKALAHESQDTVFLVVRNGDYAQCLHLEQGSFPIRTVTQHVGGLRLLGLGTGGRAILATLPDKEIEDLQHRHQTEYAEHGLAGDNLWKVVEAIRRNGHAQTVDIITPGVSGIGVAFELFYGGHAAVSVVAISDRMPADRQAKLLLHIRKLLSNQGLTRTTVDTPSSSK